MTEREQEIVIRETTTAVLSGQRIGVSNIWVRPAADAAGVVAPRVTATVTILTPGAEQGRRIDACAGTVLRLGEQRYRVDHVEEGDVELGWVTLHPTAW